jgi:acetate kinase
MCTSLGSMMPTETEYESMTEVILALNVGSTSLKFSLFATAREPGSLSLLYRGEVEGIGSEARFLVYNAIGQPQQDEQLTSKVAISHEDALHVLLEWIEGHEAGLRLIAAGHRVVHGGTLYVTPVQVDAEVLTYLEQLVPLAPLHQPHMWVKGARGVS